MTLNEILAQFTLNGTIKSVTPYGCGHINGTYLAECSDTDKKYILQRINTSIFTDPVALMENICAVTDYLDKHGRDVYREVLNVIPTKAGANFFACEEGTYRVYDFIENTLTVQTVTDAGEMRRSGEAFGSFVRCLDGFPAEVLHETIPHFHDTPKRYETFEAAVAADVCGRVEKCAEEIAFVRNHAGMMATLTDALAKGEVPLRVTHNDTKLNNVLLDPDTLRPVAVIDLDTVMPGLSLYDFGDSIRAGTNPVAEDEPDASLVYCNQEYFRAYTEGYLSACGDMLTPKEIELLPMSGIMMTLECGMRFLTDYLSGDTYFHTTREHQNLDRCHTQFKLVADMEANYDALVKTVSDLMSAVKG
ncbi:MAG: aminoglycoside phosphotransferase family protein [Clostridia bacterium]|nr:aminoglycoside phosphotransferase family protein [Clostridia bacterium]